VKLEMTSNCHEIPAVLKEHLAMVFSSNELRGIRYMGIDKNKIKTQDDLNEPAPMDQIEPRVDAKMKSVEGKAKQRVGEGLSDESLAHEGEKLRKEGE